MDGEPVGRGTYSAYLLRMWLAGSRGGQPVWRASLENPHTGERLAFGSMAALFAFLAERTDRPIEAKDIPQTPEDAGTEAEERTIP
jgi:hypothetical protein